MKLFNLSQLAVFKVKTIKNSINLENIFECWIDPIVESSPLSIKVTVAPYCDMYRVSIRLFNLDTEKAIHSEMCDLSQVGSVKELVTTLVKDWNVNNPKLKPEEPLIDIFVTTKHKESAFAWCAESDEYKVFGNTREEAIKEIKEAMTLDGIANPALNIINGDYSHQIENPLDTLFDTSELAKKVTERTIISDVNETNRFYYRQDTSKQGVYLTVIATKKNDYFISYVRHNDTGEIIRERKIIERNLSNVITLIGETVERWNRTGQPTPPKKLAINNGDINNLIIKRHKSFNVITDRKGREVCRVYGSMSERITQEGLIRDCLQEGRKQDKFKCKSFQQFQGLENNKRFQLSIPGNDFNVVLDCEKVSNAEYKILPSGAKCEFKKHWINVKLHTNPLFDISPLNYIDVENQLIKSGDVFAARFDSKYEHQFLMIKSELIDHRYECRVYRVIDKKKQETKEFTAYNAYHFVQIVKNIVLTFKLPQSIQPKILHTHQEIKTEHEAIRAKEVMKACNFEAVITNDFLFSIDKKTKEIFFPLPGGELLGLGIQKSREQWVVIAKHLGRVGSHLATRRKEIKKNGFLLDNANQICKELRLFMKIKLTENDEHKLKQLT